MFVAFAGFSALRSLANVADEMQSIQARIGQLPQTVGTAADSFDLVASKATNAKQSIEAYAGFYIKAANATQDYLTNQEDVLKVVDGVAFGLAASGATAVAQSQAFFQLGQAIGSPVVQMEEMNTLIDVAPDLFRALGKAIPGAEGNLKKFIGTGKVTGQMLAEGLIAVMPQFTEQMKAMPLTIGQATVIVGNRWATFINRINRESQTVTKVANLFLSAFDRIEASLDSLVKFFGGAEQAVKFFGIAITAVLLPILARLAVGMVAFLLSPAGLIIGALIILGLAIEDVYQYLTGGESVFQGFATWVKVLIGLVTMLGVLFGTVLVAKLVVSGAAMAAFLATSTAGVLGFAITSTIAFAQMAIAVIAATWPILLLIAALAAALYALYLLWDNWQTIWQGMKDIAANAFKGIGVLFDSLVEGMKNAWNNFKSFFGMGVSTTITASDTAATATAAGGVPRSYGGTTTYNVNQTLPPGSTAETKQAAYDATKQALGDSEMTKLARQSGQLQ